VLDDPATTLLPIPTLELRLIVQNVIFSVLDGSYSAHPVTIRVSNTHSGRNQQACFSLAVRVNGNPLCAVLSSSLQTQQRGHRTFVFEGSGIGYLIAGRLIGYLGGELLLEQLDEGTSIVKVLIPLPAAAEQQPVEASTPQVGGTGKGLRVLYIEDTHSHALFVKQIVDRLGGIDLVLAENGQNGLALAEAGPPDLILLDMELPDMSGPGIYRSLQADPRTCAIPVIALSASAMPHQISEAMQLGIRHYLTKPFSHKELSQLLLEARSAAGQSQNAA
jgi:CheY-like chemotaxis protein